MNIPDVITKDNLYSIFCSEKTGKLVSPYFKWSNIKQYPKLYDFMINYYHGVTEDNCTASELFYRIVNNIDEKPVCPVCGKYVRFKRIRDGYLTYCDECIANGNARKHIGQINVQHNLEKYGVSSLMKLQENKDKVRRTCLERYGVEAVSQVPEFIAKQKATYNERYINNPEAFNQLNQKRQQTCLKRYGVANIFEVDQFKEKAKQTCLEKYGAECVLQADIIRKKIQQTMIARYGVSYTTQNPNLTAKIIQSKKKHGTLNTSKVEQEFEQYLKENKVNYSSQYKSDEYPYYCDFYFPDYDLYLEIQGTWTHGFHPFDKNNHDDIRKLEYWTSKNSPYYKHAIEVWTVRDIKKREIALMNNLNYLEIFSCKIDTVIYEFESYIKKNNQSSI